MNHHTAGLPRRRLLGALTGATLLPTSGWAQTPASGFPNKLIRIIVPFTPGGTTDVLARAIGQRMTDLWGQPAIVDNRPGAAGWTGIAAMARTPADGHTIGLTISNIIYAKSLYTDLPFHMERDFAPISVISRSPGGFATAFHALRSTSASLSATDRVRSIRSAESSAKLVLWARR